MANITITIPDQLVTLYNEARASWNPFIEARGGVLLPAPTKTALETFVKGWIKNRVLGEAIRTDKTDVEIDVLQTLLNTL